MPKFKNILSRVFLADSRQKEDDLDYLCAGFGRFMLESHPVLYPGRDENDDNDENSMISILTMETVNDQPGTGRLIDTYIF